MIDCPKVSIILVNYNGYKDTIECIQSLREITYPNYEVIVVDNASTDESIKEIGDFLCNNVILIPSEVNGGFSVGNNVGIKYALERGAEYCLLLNNDTLVEPDFLEKLIDGFNYSNRCGLTIGKILYASDRKMIWYAGGSLSYKTARTEHWHYQERDDGLSNMPIKVTFATGCCMCLSRETIEKVGLLDETYFLYEEDVDYCCRINRAQLDMFYIPNSRIYHKVGASSKNMSVSAQYYSVRNKYILINNHYTGLRRLVANSFCTLQFAYRCMKRDMEYSVFKKALNAYKHKEIGKVII